MSLYSDRTVKRTRGYRYLYVSWFSDRTYHCTAPHKKSTCTTTRTTKTRYIEWRKHQASTRLFLLYDWLIDRLIDWLTYRLTDRRRKERIRDESIASLTNYKNTPATGTSNIPPTSRNHDPHHNDSRHDGHHSTTASTGTFYKHDTTASDSKYASFYR